MIPIRHTLPRRTVPVITRCLVATNISVFIMQLFLGPRTELLIQTFGFIPARLVSPSEWHYATWEVVITLFSSLFIHGGFVHLFGNMIYLWVFGDAVEDALGHLSFFVLYLFCGAFGSLCHTAMFPLSHVPSVGASGSIAGVLGAFFVLRPRARIVTLFPLVVYWAMAEIRAAFFLPVWFLMQFFNGFLSLAPAAGTQEVAGVAWWAHVGGFLLGAIFSAIYRHVRKKARMRIA